MQPRHGRPRPRSKSPKLATTDLRNNAKVLEWYAATKTTPVCLYDAARQRVLKLRNPEREAERRRRQHDDAEHQPELCSAGDALREVLKKLFGTNGVPLLASRSEAP